MPHIWDAADTVVKSQAGFGKLSGRMTSEGADSCRSLTAPENEEDSLLGRRGGLLYMWKNKVYIIFNSVDLVSYRFCQPTIEKCGPMWFLLLADRIAELLFSTLCCNWQLFDWNSIVCRGRSVFQGNEESTPWQTLPPLDKRFKCAEVASWEAVTVAVETPLKLITCPEMQCYAICKRPHLPWW